MKKQVSKYQWAWLFSFLLLYGIYLLFTTTPTTEEVFEALAARDESLPALDTQDTQEQERATQVIDTLNTINHQRSKALAGFNDAAEDYFELATGREMTYEEYFRTADPIIRRMANHYELLQLTTDEFITYLEANQALIEKHSTSTVVELRLGARTNLAEARQTLEAVQSGYERAATEYQNIQEANQAEAETINQILQMLATLII